jgi:hypothetical protein
MGVYLRSTNLRIRSILSQYSLRCIAFINQS